MANQTIPQRSEVPEEYTWNLKDLYESDQAWNEEYKALKTLPEQIAAFRGTLGRSAEDLLAWFRLQDQVEERLSRLYGYASCKGDEDTGNSFYQDMRGKAMSTLVTISSAAAFATPEIMEIPEDTLNLFYTAQPELETYRRVLEQLRRGEQAFTEDQSEQVKRMIRRYSKARSRNHFGLSTAQDVEKGLYAIISVARQASAELSGQLVKAMDKAIK